MAPKSSPSPLRTTASTTASAVIAVATTTTAITATPFDGADNQPHQYFQTLCQQRARLSNHHHKFQRSIARARALSKKKQLAFQRYWSKCFFWSLLRSSSTLPNARLSITPCRPSLFLYRSDASKIILTDSLLGSSPLPFFWRCRQPLKQRSFSGRTRIAIIACQ